LARGLWGIQRRNRTNAGDDSLHRATAGTSSDPNIPRGISDDITEARDDIRREIPLGLATRSHRPYGTDPFFARVPGSKLPGYDHSVPPGQKHPHAIHVSRLHIAPSAEYDDENDVHQSNPGGFKSTTLDAAW
jgi:hypothetical protein